MRCPDCGSEEFQTIGYETICRLCSLVIEDSPVQHSPKEKNIATHPSLAKAGTNQYKGRIVKTGWFFSTQQKNLQTAQAMINLAISRLKLPNHIGKEAMLIFHEAVRKRLNRGRDNVSMMYASVYAACLQHGIPKTPFEVTAHATINKTKMLRAYRIIVRGLGLKFPTIKPIDLLPRFGSKLELSASTVSRAAEILEATMGTGIRQGRRPEAILAAALYLAAKECGEPRTQREVANTTGVIEITIRKRAKEMLQHIKIQF